MNRENISAALWQIIARYDLLLKVLGATGEASPYFALGQIGCGVIVAAAWERGRIPDNVVGSILVHGTGVMESLESYVALHPEEAKLLEWPVPHDEREPEAEPPLPPATTAGRIPLFPGRGTAHS